jgi:hypothetical protein
LGGLDGSRSDVMWFDGRRCMALLEGLQLGVSLSLMARTAMAKISMISNAVIMEEYVSP